MSSPTWKSSSKLAKRIRAILASRGLSLADVSRFSLPPRTRGRREHVPHNFYEAIEKRNFSPSLYQLSALAEITGYRLADWFTVFGFSLAEITRLQAAFPSSKTVELDMRMYHPAATIPWFTDIEDRAIRKPFTPLSNWIAPAASVRMDQAALGNRGVSRYLKIGTMDNYAFPHLLPGSIVRFRIETNKIEQIPLGKTPPDALFLVQHGKGLVCSRLFRPKPNHIVLCSRNLPYAPVELELGTEAAILGIADLEIRPVNNVQPSEVPSDLGQFWTPVPLVSPSGGSHVGAFVRRARVASGLSFRKASQRTLRIAEILGDQQYFCSPGSLSDYEANRFPPRHMHKLIAICAVYFASIAGLLRTCGIDMDQAGRLPIPPEFLKPHPKQPGDSEPIGHSAFLDEMRRQFVEFPLSLSGSLASIFGLPELSLRDAFWLGDSFESLHPSLIGARFLIVDRKRKTPHTRLEVTVRDQPLYVLRRRDGTCFCGSCALHGDSIVIRPWTSGLPKLLKLRDEVDVEVVGQIVGIVRHLG